MNESMICSGKVSVVTPVYNGEAYLGKMLESVLGQTYPDLEMILVDDGSSDNTVRVAEGYRERFAQKGYSYRIVKAEHKNASSAVNRGLAYVTGEYLIWPDSDDILEPESVEKRVEFLKGHPEYRCVRSLSRYVDARTGELCERSDEQRGDLGKEELFWDILESKTFVCCGCYMLRTEAFLGIYPKRRIPEYDVGQNFQMLLPFMYYYKCPTICEELYNVTVRPGSHSRRELSQAEEEKKYKDYEHLIDEIARICRIDDRKSKNRIICWKARRRCVISMKYGRKGKALAAIVRLFYHGGMQNWSGRTLKETVWLWLGTGRLGGKLYSAYRRITKRTR